MKSQLITRIITLLSDLSSTRLAKLQYELAEIFNDYECTRITTDVTLYKDKRIDLIQRFLVAKKVEGLAKSSLKLYALSLRFFVRYIEKPLNEIDTNDIRVFLARYGMRENVTQRTVDNMRRYLNSFYSWLFAEELIKSNPMGRIKQIKFDQKMKQAFTPEQMELIRNACSSNMERALVEFLYSTGCRIKEVLKLNRADVNWKDNNVVVLGKGGKERICYINARARVHLDIYLRSRHDSNEALFVGRTHQRLTHTGAEKRLQLIGVNLGFRVHPHKFRRTSATTALKSGMPFEQVRLMLGHASPQTTMLYTTIDQDQLRINHSKFLQ